GLAQDGHPARLDRLCEESARGGRRRERAAQVSGGPCRPDQAAGRRVRPRTDGTGHASGAAAGRAPDLGGVPADGVGGTGRDRGGTTTGSVRGQPVRGETPGAEAVAGRNPTAGRSGPGEQRAFPARRLVPCTVRQRSDDPSGFVSLVARQRLALTPGTQPQGQGLRSTRQVQRGANFSTISRTSDDATRCASATNTLFSCR